MMRKIASLIALALVSNATFSQVQVDQLTADAAVQLLLGSSIQYSNAQFTGDALQLGGMSGAVNPFEVPSGIVLATADVQTLEPGNFGTFLNTPVSGNADLLSVANSVPPLIGQSFSVSSVNDVAVLEFDFVATGTALSFDFIFGSNEYLTFVNTQYNDVFGFFLSGPGITGPYQDGATNIAIIPNSNPALPVTISSVNPGLNSNYYIDNPSQEIVALNGYTNTLTAVANLICGETYHIRLAIADGVDTSLDSMVILEEGSFNISSNLIQPIVVNPAPGFPALSILEGCIEGQFVITPPQCIVEQLVLDIILGGTAISGVDYTTSLTDQIVFEPGDSEIVVDIQAIVDDLVEGTEEIIISFDYETIDGLPATASASLNLIDYQPLEVAEIPVTNICPNSSEVVDPVTSLGFGGLTYLWSSGQTTATATYSEGDAGEYEVFVTDYCGSTDSATFIITEPLPFAVVDTVVLCFSGTSSALIQGGSRPYDVTYDTLGLAYNSQTELFTGLQNGIYLVEVIDQCGQEGDILVTVQPCGTLIPNIFTPNSDAQNKAFVIQGVQFFPGSSLTVWNRWGTIVFESDNYNNQWDGDDSPDGTYFYVFQRSDGEIYSGNVMIKRGE